MRDVLPTAPNMCFYITLVKMKCQISTCSTTDTGFIDTKGFFFVCKNNFDIFAEIHQKMLKIRVAVWHHTIPLPYKNHATDAIKSVVRRVNMKFRKLKRNNVRNTNKTRQLKQEVPKMSSMGIHVGVQHRDREQKKFCGNKTSTGC